MGEKVKIETIILIIVMFFAAFTMHHMNAEIKELRQSIEQCERSRGDG